MAIIEQTDGRLFRLAETGNTGCRVQALYEALRQASESAQLAFNHDSGVTGVTRALGASIAGSPACSPRTSLSWPAEHGQDRAGRQYRL